MAETKQGSGALVGLGVVALVAGVGIAIAVHLSHESTSAVTSALTLGSETFAPIRCRSGLIGDDGPRDRPHFRGVELVSASGDVVRVLEDPSEGRRVLAVPHGGDPRAIDRSACERFELELRDTGESIGSVWGMEGELALECPEARGTVRFERCYGGR